MAVHALGLPAPTVAGIEVEQSRFVGIIQLFRHFEGKFKFSPTHRITSRIQHVVARKEGIGYHLSVVVSVPAGDHLPLGVIETGINQSVEIGELLVVGRPHFALDRHPRTGAKQQAVGLDLGEQRVVDGRDLHLVRGGVKPQGRVTEQDVVEFVHQHIVGIAGDTVLTPTHDIAQPHDPAVVVAVEKVLDNRLVDVAVGMDIYHAGGRDKGDTAALGVEEQFLAARIGPVIEAAEIAGGRNPQGQARNIHVRYVAPFEDFLGRPPLGTAVPHIIDNEQPVALQEIEHLFLGIGIGGSRGCTHPIVGIDVKFVD